MTYQINLTSLDIEMIIIKKMNFMKLNLTLMVPSQKDNVQIAFVCHYLSYYLGL